MKRGCGAVLRRGRECSKLSIRRSVIRCAALAVSLFLWANSCEQKLDNRDDCTGAGGDRDGCTGAGGDRDGCTGAGGDRDDCTGAGGDRDGCTGAGGDRDDCTGAGGDRDDCTGAGGDRDDCTGAGVAVAATTVGAYWFEGDDARAVLPCCCRGYLGCEGGVEQTG